MKGEKLLKFLGVFCTVAGAFAGIGSNFVSEKKRSIEMDKKIDEALEKKMAKAESIETEES